jgi:hypothetical protein
MKLAASLKEKEKKMKNSVSAKLILYALISVKR